MTGDIMMLAIGWKDGLMIVKGWRLPACVPVWLKSKDYGIQKAREHVTGKGL